MPKSKEFVESDNSSDSGSSSESEKKGKKRQKKEIKQKESKGGSSGKKSKSDEEPIWELGDKCRVTIRGFKGKTYIDIRHMYEDKDSGDLKPSKKGISLTPKLWKSFMEVVEEVDNTVKEKC